MASSRDLIQQAILQLPDADAPELDARWLLVLLWQIDHRDPQLHQDLRVSLSRGKKRDMLRLQVLCYHWCFGKKMLYTFASF